MRSAATCVWIAAITLAANSAWSQQNPVGTAAPQAPVGSAAPQAPIGHRQPTVKDLPPDVARGQEQPADVARGEQQPESAPSRGRNAQARAGGLPMLDVGRSCEAAGTGAAVLGRDKKACLGDETTAQDTLRQNWAKYAAGDKGDCIGMVTTGGPASYVELLSCVEILRDARNIHNADALEGDDSAISSRRQRARVPMRAR